MAREIKIPVSTCEICDKGRHPGDVPSEPCGHNREKHAKMLTLTAYDQRDVGPLVEAARKALDLCEGPEHPIADGLIDALKPFEETGEES